MSSARWRRARQDFSNACSRHALSLLLSEPPSPHPTIRCSHFFIDIERPCQTDRRNRWTTPDGMPDIERRRFVCFLCSGICIHVHSLMLPFRYDNQDDARWNQPQRGPDGRYQPVEQIYPMEQPFIGGFSPAVSPPASFIGAPSPFPSPLPSPGLPPPLPPKDALYQNNGGPPFVSKPPYAESMTSFAESTNSAGSYMYATQQLAHMSPVERSQNLRVARMQPYLQFMAGPLLRYDTVDADGVWRGAAMIVSECLIWSKI